MSVIGRGWLIVVVRGLIMSVRVRGLVMSVIGRGCLIVVVRVASNECQGEGVNNELYWEHGSFKSLSADI